MTTNNTPSALAVDIADKIVVHTHMTYLPANETIEYDFIPAVYNDGSIWVYFADEVVAETGEICRQIYKGE